MTIAGLQDKDLFAETMEAFQIMSISEEERTGTSSDLFGLIVMSSFGTYLLSDRFPEGGISRASVGEHDVQEGTTL